MANSPEVRKSAPLMLTFTMGIGSHLAMSPLRQAPWTLLLVGALDFWLALPFTWAAFWVAGQIVVRGPVYQYIPATTF